MNLSLIDWTIVVCFFVFMTSLAVFTKKYTKSVSDFLAANRCAGRYLLAVAGGMSAMGAISVVGVWEMYYRVGFSVRWWTLMYLPVAAIIAVTGYAMYRYRQTRAMTLAQFFEIRYSKAFRVFAGILGFVSGIINFGIFPAIGSYFFIYFCGLPLSFTLYGLEVSTFSVVMLLLIIISLSYTWIGGQIAVVVTDYIQGMFLYVTFILILVFLFLTIDWSSVAEVLTVTTENTSKINPMHTGQVKDFNMWFVLITIFGAFYAPLGWQGSQAYTCSAKSPHESKMANILGTWKNAVIQVFLVIPAVLAFVFLTHAHYGSLADSINAVVGPIENSYISRQMIVPVAMSQILPWGLRGALCAAMLACFISTHDTYMHSWGSIFLQDVIMPFRKKPFTPKQHLLLLRLSVLGVAVFIFCFSMFFEIKEAILMFMAVTGAIFIGGAGSAIIGGLYWKRGTTAGAWASMITGASCAIGGIVARQVWPGVFGYEFPINSQWVFGISMWSSIAVYILFSLLENKTFNMDRMLHRGEYAINMTPEGGVQNTDGFQEERNAGPVRKLLLSMGLSKEFTKGDRVILVLSLVWAFGWFSVFLMGTIYNLLVEVTDDFWIKFWQIEMGIGFVLGLIVTVWFAVGGIRDIKYMFTKLSSLTRNDKDDGMVIDHHNRGEK